MQSWSGSDGFFFHYCVNKVLLASVKLFTCCCSSRSFFHVSRVCRCPSKIRFNLFVSSINLASSSALCLSLSSSFSFFLFSSSKQRSSSRRCCSAVQRKKSSRVLIKYTCTHIQPHMCLPQLSYLHNIMLKVSNE